MSGKTKNKPSIWFWIVSGVFLLWNIMGVYAYISDVSMSDEAIAAFSIVEQEFYARQPAWSVGLYAIATWGALLACILLFVRSALAVPVFIVSLICIVVQFGYTLFGMNMLEKMGWSSAIFPAIIFVIGLIEVWYASLAKRKMWIS